MTNITPEEVKKRLDKGEALNLVDVREPYENAEFNIGGKLLPLGKIQSMQIEDIEDLRDKEVILILQKRKQERNCSNDAGPHGIYQHKESYRRHACMAGKI